MLYGTSVICVYLIDAQKINSDTALTRRTDGNR